MSNSYSVKRVGINSQLGFIMVALFYLPDNSDIKKMKSLILYSQPFFKTQSGILATLFQVNVDIDAIS